ncbi:MAG: LLM class flavin-dependent oxidoreductase, partial [Alphaproteobacteria bacterium]|nr:LLM class flavin-dependent oxidoreductase [Alphaproteobacteria bacterium]
ASRMTQLDHMTRGRAMFGVGPGALVHDAAKLAIEPAAQRSRMSEALDVVIELMRGDLVTRKTDWFDLREAQLQLKSYSQPAMEMAVACARSPVGAVASGRHGIGMLSIGGTSDDALKAHANNWSIYTENAVAAGKIADRSKWRIVTFAHVAPTREQARRDVEFGLADYCKYFTDVATFPIIPAGITDPLEYLTSEGIACIGTPDDCIRHFERLWTGSGGGFGAVLLLAHNWADWPATQRSYELMARFVHPHFQRQANSLRRLSYDTATASHDTHLAAASRAVMSEIEKHKAAKGQA